LAIAVLGGSYDKVIRLHRTYASKRRKSEVSGFWMPSAKVSTLDKPGASPHVSEKEIHPSYRIV